MPRSARSRTFPSPGSSSTTSRPCSRTPSRTSAAIDLMLEPYRDEKIDLVVGMESRGFIFSAPMAYLLKAGLVPVRKLGKLPAETITVEYALEYGSNTLEIHRDAIQSGQRVLIIDDLLATGGTVHGTIELSSGSRARSSGWRSWSSSTPSRVATGSRAAASRASSGTEARSCGRGRPRTSTPTKASPRPKGVDLGPAAVLPPARGRRLPGDGDRGRRGQRTPAAVGRRPARSSIPGRRVGCHRRTPIAAALAGGPPRGFRTAFRLDTDGLILVDQRRAAGQARRGGMPNRCGRRLGHPRDGRSWRAGHRPGGGLWAGADRAARCGADAIRPSSDDPDGGERPAQRPADGGQPGLGGRPDAGPDGGGRDARGRRHDRRRRDVGRGRRDLQRGDTGPRPARRARAGPRCPPRSIGRSRS